MKNYKSFITVLMMCISLVLLAACGNASNDSNTDEKSDEKKVVRLGTMNDEEGRIIGQMMLQLLEDKGYEVKSTVGELANNTTLMRTGIMEDQLDLSLDYTGRGLAFIENPDVSKYQEDLQTAFETTKEADDANGVVWLTYAPFNNTDSLVITQEFSDEHNIKSFEDLSKYINDGGNVKIAVEAGYEYYATAPTTIPGWASAYGFEIPEENIVMGVSDAKTAVASNTDNINVATSNATSGLIEALNLIKLEDPKNVSPIYSPAPIATKGILEKHPELKTMFNDLFASLDEETMVHLNSLLEESGQSEEVIAQNYLVENNFITK